jgi:glycosyltransferase involved in cell wall biosynthesis
MPPPGLVVVRHNVPDTGFKTMKICIDARVTPGLAGGTARVVSGLVRALADAHLDDEFVFLTLDGAPWLDTRGIGVRVNSPVPRTNLTQAFLASHFMRRAPFLRSIWRAVSPSIAPPTLRASDGTIESLRCDVIHFTTQNGFVTNVPSVFQPWDLQHFHFPDFFTARERKLRSYRYKAYCEQAAVVVAPTTVVRNDLVHYLDIPQSKVVVIPIPPTKQSPPPQFMRKNLRTRLGLQGPYALYPAQTWPHKNHARLIGAMRMLRDNRGIAIPLVCTGAKNDHFPELERLLRTHRLTDQVVFPGYLTDEEIAALYADARLLVFPSLFEGWGLPILEAFATGLPVACSRLASLTPVTEGAALWFDPSDVADIAEKVCRLWCDDQLREDLSNAGLIRAAMFDWSVTVAAYHACYRIAAGQTTGSEWEALSAVPHV